MLGVMIDCSRNGVMSVSAIKKFVSTVSKMGYDTVMLYTEDTFEVEGEPYFGYMRGRYSRSELKEIDAYCKELGVELIPCIQTLAHLNAIFHSTYKYYDIRDCDDILLLDSERTYQLLENIFSTIAECFTSKRVHIGMDEADKVGLGKYLKKNGYKNRFDIINRHLHKVCEIADKYGLNPMLWSDMFCNLANESGNAYESGDFSEIKQKAALPENVSLVYWDYYNDDYNHYKKMIELNKAFDRPVVFAGGAWTWKGFAPDNGFTVKTSIPALKACKDFGINDVLITMWGDDGGECSRFAVLPSLFYISELYRGNTDEADIKARFEKITGISYNDFSLLDELDKIGGEHSYNPSKYLLYNDVFTGLNDYRVKESDGEYYAQLAGRLKKINAAEYTCEFNVSIALCELLAVKAPLGIKTRKAYRENNKEALRQLALNDYALAVLKTEEFHGVLSDWWLGENKPFGFDIQDIRLGGLAMRIKSCAARLIDFADGKIESIPELETELLAGDGKVSWQYVATPNVVSHIFFG